MQEGSAVNVNSLKHCRLLHAWLTVLLLPSLGCLNKIPAVAHYQDEATRKCREHHSVEECKPLPYPSERPGYPQ